MRIKIIVSSWHEGWHALTYYVKSGARLQMPSSKATNSH